MKGADECSKAAAGNKANGDVFFFQDFQYADMRDAASKAAAQGKANLWGRSLTGTEQRKTSRLQGMHRVNDL
jgi:hypothetical protein